MGHMEGTLGPVIATEPRFCGLRVTTSLPTSTGSSPSRRDTRLVHLTVPGPRIGNVLTTSSRGNHTLSSFETSLFISSRVRIPTTVSCVSHSAGSVVTLNSEPPQGIRVLIDEQPPLTTTAANDWYNSWPVSSHMSNSGVQSPKKRCFSLTHSYRPQKKWCQAKSDSPAYMGCSRVR